MKRIFLLITLALNILVHCDINMNYAYCGVNKVPSEDKKKPIHIQTTVDHESTYQPIRIKADYTFLDTQAPYLRIPVIKAAMENVIENAKELFKVQRFKSNIQLPADKVIDFADLPSNGFDSSSLTLKEHDLVIFIVPSTEIGDAVTYARPIFLYGKNKRPVAGVIKIQKPFNLNPPNSVKFMEDLLLHSLTHIMVFTENLYQHYPKGSPLYKETKNIRGKDKYLISSPKVLAAAKRHFGCDTMKGLELEEKREGTYGSHWEGRIMLGDYMIEAVYMESVISEMTLALFEDSGWYQVNYYTGGLFRFGKNKKCDFLELSCIYLDAENPSKGDKTRFHNDFVSKFDRHHELCSPSRISRGYGLIKDYEVGFFYKYNHPKVFNSANIGGWEGADFCPVVYDRPDPGSIRGDLATLFGGFGYYYSHCKYGSSDGSDYSKFLYSVSKWTDEYDYNGYSASTTSDHSFCALSKVLNRAAYSSNPADVFKFWFTSPYRAVCLEMFCSDTKLTIQAGNEFVVCPKEGGMISLENSAGQILCPDYNLICTGTVMCSSLQDCIQKKSKVKANAFDYSKYPKEVNTTQDSEEVGHENKEDIEDSENGKCSKFCSRCVTLEGTTGKTQCLKCGEGYTFYSETEEEENYICIETKTLESGPYYAKNGIYHKCRDKCHKCTSATDCQKCQSGFVLIEGDICLPESEFVQDEYYYLEPFQFKCSNLIPNCKTCKSPEHCSKCKDGYTMLNHERKICVQDIYKDDEKYFPVPNMYLECLKHADIRNCLECGGDNDCKRCKPGYAFLDGHRDICFDEKNFTLGNAFKKFEDPLEYKSCDREISNCEYCEANGQQCKQCKYGYGFGDPERKTCVEIADGKFFQEGIIWYPCYISNENCDYCHYRRVCNKCKDGYFIFKKSEAEHVCLDKSLLDTKEYFEEDDVYHKCSDAMPNCKSCEDGRHCISCEDGYTFLDDAKDKCLKISYLEKPIYYPPGKAPKYTCTKNNVEPLGTCLECKEKETCDTCVNGYVFLDNDFTRCHYKNGLVGTCPDPSNPKNYFTCKSKIENCKTCVPGSCEVCQECKAHYGFIDTEHKKCVDITKGYYYDTAAGYYKKCSETLEGCIFCHKDTSNKLLCDKCDTEYCLMEDKKCGKNSDLKDFYYSDNGICRICNSGVNHCKRCSSDDVCLECEENYAFFEGDSHTCHLNNFKTDEYYYIEPSYYECSRHNIEYCLRCSGPKQCTQCRDGFAFLDNDKNKCHNIATLPPKALPESTYNYKSCGSLIPNCEECSGTIENPVCLKCHDGYATDNGNNKICKSTAAADCYIDTDGSCYDCNKSLEGCSKCRSKFECIECNEGYLINKHHSKCAETNIPHCIKYRFNDEDLLCQQCETGYILLNENYYKCVKDENLDPPKYFPFPTKGGPEKKSCQLFGIPNCLECNDMYTCSKCEEGFLIDTDNHQCVKLNHCEIAKNKDTCAKCQSDYSEILYLIDGKCKTCSELGCQKCNPEGKCVECNVPLCVQCLESNQCILCESGYVVRDNFGACELLELPPQLIYYGFSSLIPIYINVNVQLSFNLVFLSSTSIASLPAIRVGGLVSSTTGSAGTLRTLKTEEYFTCRVKEDNVYSNDMEYKPRNYQCLSESKFKDGKYQLNALSEDQPVQIEGKDKVVLSFYNWVKTQEKKLIRNLGVSNDVIAKANEYLKNEMKTLTINKGEYKSCEMGSDVRFIMDGTFSEKVESQKNVKFELVKPKLASALCNITTDTSGVNAYFECATKAYQLNSFEETIGLAEKDITLKNGETFFIKNANATKIGGAYQQCIENTQVVKVCDSNGKVVSKNSTGAIAGLISAIVVVIAASVFGMIYYKKCYKKTTSSHVREATENPIRNPIGQDTQREPNNFDDMKSVANTERSIVKSEPSGMNYK